MPKAYQDGGRNGAQDEKARLRGFSLLAPSAIGFTCDTLAEAGEFRIHHSISGGVQKGVPAFNQAEADVAGPT